jgi:nucleoid DNA-binding protein
MSKSINIYIKELMETTDCVVIPGFGAFVGERREAQINPHTHQFSPPFKEIMFNDSLVRDDGVLTQYIAVEEGISYAESHQIVENQVDEWKQILLKEEILKFDEIGELTLNREGNFIFSPFYDLNYLQDSFGLQKFISPAVRHQSNKKTIALAAENSSPVTFVATFFLLFALSAIWFYFQWSEIDNQYSQQSTIIPVSTYKNIEKTEIKKAIKTKETTKPATSTKKVIENKEESETKKVEKERKTIPSKTHYIIAGAFRDSRNAKNLIQKLKRQGFNAGIAGLSPKGLLIVYYNAYTDAHEAIKALKEIKKYKPSAWLYSK